MHLLFLNDHNIRIYANMESMTLITVFRSFTGYYAIKEEERSGHSHDCTFSWVYFKGECTTHH